MQVANSTTFNRTFNSNSNSYRQTNVTDVSSSVDKKGDFQSFMKTPADNGVQQARSGSSLAQKGVLNLRASSLQKSSLQELPQSLKANILPEFDTRNPPEIIRGIMAPAAGAANSDGFDSFNGSAYNDFIDSEMASRKDDLGFEHTFAMPSEGVEQKRRILHEQTPQTAVFKVGDSIIGSLNEKGFVDINANLLEQADASGINRDSLKPFYSYDQMSNTDSDKVQTMLQHLFGENLKVEHFSGAEMPTLQVIRSEAKAEVLPL